MAAKKTAAPAASPFAKPAAAKQGGNFKFKLPETIGSGRGRIPKGPYIGRCTDILSDTSKSSGNPMWTWTFVITKGAHAGRDFKLWTVLTDDAAWKIVETLKALGIEVAAGDEINIAKKDVIGVGCTMHIKDDNGKDGDGEFSKLDKISAHPQGAGYKGGSGLAGKAAAAAEEEEPEEVEEEATGFQCQICDEVFEDEDDLTSHIDEAHQEGTEDETDLTGEEPEQFECAKCDFVGTEEEVDEHFAQEHSKPKTKAKTAPPARGKAPATLGRAGKKR